MKVTAKSVIVSCMMLISFFGKALADDFFSVGQIKLLMDPSKDEKGPYQSARINGKWNKAFLSSCLEVKLRTQKDIQTNSIYVRAYFFDKDGRKIASQVEPFPVNRGGMENYAMPSLFKSREWGAVFFVVPESLRKSTGWKALIVFGDQSSANAKVYPIGHYHQFEFAEREKVESTGRIKRKEAMDPVVEHVIRTNNPKQPQITLLLRPPIGMTDATQANGVLALCAIANSVSDIKRRLQTLTPKDDLSWVLRFAEKHKLVILCWGSAGGLWPQGKSWHDLTKKDQDEIDRSFGQIADAWTRSVKDLSRKYGFPDSGFLMVGHSAAAQYSIGIALRHPELFQAVYVHIPSTFDKPTTAANRLLWCLTTGELEYGYSSSLKFYQQCRQLGYPIVYKAIMGIGHQGSPYADRFGEAFLEWALMQKAEREKFEEELSNAFSPIKQEWEKNPLRAWPEAYRSPPYVGDAVNQEMFPWEDHEMVPEGFRVPLPTKPIADAWNAQKL
jgi:hypothetical protein